MNPFGTGAVKSDFDSRTWRHETTMGAPLVEGGYKYLPEEHLHQHKVGICTSIHLVQNAEKYFGKKFSPDFQYLLQKKYYDLGWWEGSSIFNALKVGKNFGFLPIELFTWITEADRSLPYSEYVAKLQAIPESEIQRLIGLCTHKLAGYASLKTDALSLAKGIQDSKAGILCRYTVDDAWWTAPEGYISWAKSDLERNGWLRAPKTPYSGHAIIKSYFNFNSNKLFTVSNTWGKDWNDNGDGHINNDIYKCDEAWIPYFNASDIPVPETPVFIFTKDMKYGETSEDVKQLQKRLGVIQTGYYGDLTQRAVYRFQLDKGLPLSWYERNILVGRLCGFKTRSALNQP